jgi:hypothetical protein
LPAHGKSRFDTPALLCYNRENLHYCNLRETMNKRPLARSCALFLVIAGTALNAAARSGDFLDVYWFKVLKPQVKTWIAMMCAACRSDAAQMDAAAVVTSHSQALVERCIPGARVVNCSVAAPDCIVILARVADSDRTVQLTVQCVNDPVRRTQALIMDQPLDLPGGVRVAAHTPVPLETVMHAFALARTARAATSEPLTLKTAKINTFYGDKDYHKGTVRTQIRGSINVPYTAFSEISQFAISAMPTVDDPGVIHTFACMPAGMSDGKTPKYSHVFMASDDPANTKRSGFFVATLKNNTLSFVYTWTLTDVYDETSYNDIRNKAATTPAMFRRTLKYARYTLTVNGVEYAADNVPLLVRGSKSSATSTKVKPPAATALKL